MTVRQTLLLFHCRQPTKSSELVTTEMAEDAGLLLLLLLWLTMTAEQGEHAEQLKQGRALQGGGARCTGEYADKEIAGMDRRVTRVYRGGEKPETQERRGLRQQRDLGASITASSSSCCSSVTSSCMSPSSCSTSGGGAAPRCRGSRRAADTRHAGSTARGRRHRAGKQWRTWRISVLYPPW